MFNLGHSDFISELYSVSTSLPLKRIITDFHINSKEWHEVQQRNAQNFA